jgi:cleavage and polyadenylation specificity factor subunit 5
MAASSDVQGLKRKLSSKLSVLDDGEADAEEEEDDWQVGECIGMWWRSEFEAIPFPYMPPSFRAPKVQNVAMSNCIEA